VLVAVLTRSTALAFPESPGAGPTQAGELDTPGTLAAVAAGSAPLLSGSAADASATDLVIRGTVFLDANNNAQRDPGESGLAGVTVYLKPLGGERTPPLRLAVTNDRGAYEFRGVPPGTYEVGVVWPAGLAQTAPPQNGSRIVDVSKGKRAATGVDFGATSGADPSRTGLDRDGAEGAGLPGWVCSLFAGAAFPWLHSWSRPGRSGKLAALGRRHRRPTR
jgi:hypothetical protein